MSNPQFLDSIDDSLEQLQRSVLAAGWNPLVIDEARTVLLAVLKNSNYEAASSTIRSKAEILVNWRYLKYWYFEGAPLSVQIALWVGLETGFLQPPADGRARIEEFTIFFRRQLAFEAAKRRSETVGGWIFPGEAELFWETIEATSAIVGDVAEIGSWVGRSSVLIASGLAALAPGKRLHVVDDWCFGDQPNLYPYLSDNRILRAEFEENTAPWQDRIIIHQGLFQEVSDQLTKTSKTGFSMIFHDAGHTAEDFSRDLPLIERLLNPGGCLLIHDYVSINFCESRPTITAWVESTPGMVLTKTVGTCAVIERQQ